LKDEPAAEAMSDTASIPLREERSEPAKSGAPSTPSPRVAEKRAQKIAEIIRVATRFFNRKGFLATTMDEIAAELDMNPATLYHYVGGKQELAYRAYLKSCEMRRAQLVRAESAGGSGLERVEIFIRALLGTEYSRPAMLSEVGALRPEWADHIRSLQRGNINAVQRMVADGIRDGSISPSNPFLTGIGILSVVEWMTFWYTDRLPYSRSEVVDLLTDVLVSGVTQPDARLLDVPMLPLSYPQPAPPNPFDREAMTNLKLEQFLRVAMESFNKVGVHATSIDQCAQQLNLTKGAFYYYFKNKEELLYLCYRRAIRYNREAGRGIQMTDPVEREIHWRRALFERHISEHGPFPTYHHVTFLSATHHEEIMTELMSQQHLDVGIVGRAIRDGHYRKVDEYVAEKVRAGLTNWFPTWYSPNGRASPTEVADNHSQLFLYGLRPR
jgi:AcrR family transcriptional regulator